MPQKGLENSSNKNHWPRWPTLQRELFFFSKKNTNRICRGKWMPYTVTPKTTNLFMKLQKKLFPEKLFTFTVVEVDDFFSVKEILSPKDGIQKKPSSKERSSSKSLLIWWFFFWGVQQKQLIVFSCSPTLGRISTKISISSNLLESPLFKTYPSPSPTKKPGPTSVNTALIPKQGGSSTTRHWGRECRGWHLCGAFGSATAFTLTGGLGETVETCPGRWIECRRCF